MTLSVSFVVPGTPVGKGRPRAFRRGNGIAMHTPDKTANYENLVRLAAAEAMAGQPPLRDPVSVSLMIHLTPPASWSQRKRAQALGGEIRPTTTPDIDNTIKSIFDAMNGVVFGDDRQVVSLSAAKTYQPAARVVVVVESAEWCAQ